uniref:Fatty acid hydroxylase domain-containing protein n=1 Tax=Chromera velia CCMP2878 TaxID=1169474 RepID=A0A0G4I189_9ALVE|eukprot:Cvel_39.t1-p1 / transcript=Cvel_39.t1 / gene=Cvel_39 / organism=Chromera_velia_CCMP2878 / gene_product=Cholesterol 25-hydroxylase-like protein 1, member 2, putative / transcript_product=Cholesterol 25-hydroxylase-like protein 1, member 2, putative / location=Cvel_scaffold5:223966-226904(-) / protein_length=326 / sequence_SO=supercontig / SO=protein_coding / is_pseudo=false
MVFPYCRRDFAALQLSSRLVVLVVLVTCFLHRQRLDDLLDSFWGSLRRQPWIKHDSCEPLFSTVVFFFWVNLFRFFDLYCPFLWRFRYNQRDDPVKEGFLIKTQDPHGVLAVVGYIVPLLAFDVLFPRRRLPERGPSFFGLLGSVAASLWLYDLLFFFVHLGFHKIPLFQGIHRRHHQEGRMKASEVVRLSFLDGALQVGANILALNLLRLHPLARLLHDAAITFLLTEIHSGYDFPWALHRILPEGVMAGPEKHELHHILGTGYFQQFFCYLDNLFGLFPEEKRAGDIRRVWKKRKGKASASSELEGKLVCAAGDCEREVRSRAH